MDWKAGEGPLMRLVGLLTLILPGKHKLTYLHRLLDWGTRNVVLRWGNRTPEGSRAGACGGPETLRGRRLTLRNTILQR